MERRVILFRFFFFFAAADRWGRFVQRARREKPEGL